MFVGDVLFAGSIGRTDLPGGSMEQLLDSIKNKLLTLDDDVEVFSGHGLKGITIGEEKLTNPFLTGVSLRPRPFLKATFLQINAAASPSSLPNDPSARCPTGSAGCQPRFRSARKTVATIRIADHIGLIESETELSSSRDCFFCSLFITLFTLLT